MYARILVPTDGSARDHPDMRVQSERTRAERIEEVDVYLSAH